MISRFLILLFVQLTLSRVAQGSRTARPQLWQRRSVNQTTSSVCATSPEWQSTQYAWQNSNADTSLRALLANITTDKSKHFDQTLGSQYGAHYPAYKCGINLYSSCPLPACSDYETHTGETWAYLATVSTVHLATKFNILYTAVTNGQLDFQGVIDDLADNFFYWKDPVFVGDDMAFWVVAIITVAASALTLPFNPAAGVAIAGVGTFLGAATQEVTLSLTPEAGVTRNVGISYLKKTSSQIGQQSRDGIESWANNTFAGLADHQGKTIIDYFRGGSFLFDGAIPSPGSAEKFYKSAMIAKTIDWQWNTKANFLMFTSTNDSNAAYGPNASRYYSQNKRGAYNLYNLESSTLQQPSGLNLLNDSVYGILPSQVTKAAARAWEFAGNNYTTEIAMSRIEASFDSNGSLNPFADGAAWEGMFTLPVCDVGKHSEWLTDYGGNGLPCCCGIDCVDTKAFVKAANLDRSATLYKGCKALLKDTLINFDKIDYSIDMRYPFLRKWQDEWSIGQKAGISIGLIFAGVTVIGILAAVIGLIIGCCLD